VSLSLRYGLRQPYKPSAPPPLLPAAHYDSIVSHFALPPTASSQVLLHHPRRPTRSLPYQTTPPFVVEFLTTFDSPPESLYAMPPKGKDQPKAAKANVDKVCMRGSSMRI